MTALLDPTRRRVTTLPTATIPAARRSTPDQMRTAPIARARGGHPIPAAAPHPSAGTRRHVALVGAALVVGGIAAVVGVSLNAPLPPLPAATGTAAVAGSPCSAGSCTGLDPTGQDCQQDARTASSRVITAERHGIEVPVGAVEVRGSAVCRAVWARYTLDTTAPVAEVAIESRDGRSEHTPVDAVPGHRRLGYGTTPMLAADDVRAVVSPAPGGELPSRATAWAR